MGEMFFGGQRVAPNRVPLNGGFDYLGDDSGDGGFDWNDFADSGLKSLTSILNTRQAASAAKVGANPYAVSSLVGGGNPFGIGLQPGALTSINPTTGLPINAASVAGGIGAAGGSLFDGIARAIGVPTSWLFIGGGVLLVFWFMPSPRRR
jgi:hypothetical protein